MTQPSSDGGAIDLTVVSSVHRQCITNADDEVLLRLAQTLLDFVDDVFDWGARREKEIAFLLRFDEGDLRDGRDSQKAAFDGKRIENVIVVVHDVVCSAREPKASLFIEVAPIAGSVPYVSFVVFDFVCCVCLRVVDVALIDMGATDDNLSHFFCFQCGQILMLWKFDRKMNDFEPNEVNRCSGDKSIFFDDGGVDVMMCHGLCFGGAVYRDGLRVWKCITDVLLEPSTYGGASKRHHLQTGNGLLC